jgi:SPP1 family phage portal protein
MVGGQVIPRFVKADPKEIIPIYNYDIEPKLTAAIRTYWTGDNRQIYVYYPDTMQHFVQRSNDNSLNLVEEESHEYKAVPLVIYQNNEEELGDFEHIKKLIDAYDILMSDSMNEFDRFAWAYLILKGMSMDEEDASRIKDKRILEFVAEGGADFLTKDIPADFLKFMAEWIRKEIHKQSHIPDFIDAGTGDNLSGVAIDKLLYDFEFVAATKEALFRQGLAKRFDLINTILRKSRGVTIDKRDVDIVMQRNVPSNDLENAKVFQAYAGMLSTRTLIENYATFTDWQTEEERLEEEGPMVDVEAGFAGAAGST